MHRKYTAAHPTQKAAIPLFFFSKVRMPADLVSDGSKGISDGGEPNVRNEPLLDASACPPCLLPRAFSSLTRSFSHARSPESKTGGPYSRPRYQRSSSQPYAADSIPHALHPPCDGRTHEPRHWFSFLDRHRTDWTDQPITHGDLAGAGAFRGALS